MPDPPHDLDLLVHAVALSGVYGVLGAARELDIGERTIKRYRQYAQEHPDLQPRIDALRAELDREWGHRYGAAIVRGIEFLEKAFESLNPADPDAVHAAAGAVKLLSDMRYMSKMLDLRLAGVTARPPQLPAAKVTVDVSVSRPDGEVGEADRQNDPDLPPGLQ